MKKLYKEIKETLRRKPDDYIVIVSMKELRELVNLIDYYKETRNK